MSVLLNWSLLRIFFSARDTSPIRCLLSSIWLGVSGCSVFDCFNASSMFALFNARLIEMTVLSKFAARLAESISLRTRPQSVVRSGRFLTNC